tara:strand:+ start:222 stop:521 length:300 start_codon:yes stop_codon:yes gene_type:complete
MITITKPYIQGNNVDPNNLLFQEVYFRALSETGNYTRKCHINDKIAELIKNKEVRFTGDIENNWQVATGYCQQQKKKEGVVAKIREGSYTYWYKIEEDN